MRRFSKIGAGGVDVARGISDGFRRLSRASSTSRSRNSSVVGRDGRQSSSARASAVRRDSKLENGQSDELTAPPGLPLPRHSFGEAECVTGVRIVGFTDEPGHTEYEIHCVTSTGSETFVWRRYSDFPVLHAAVHEVAPAAAPCSPSPVPRATSLTAAAAPFRARRARRAYVELACVRIR